MKLIFAAFVGLVVFSSQSSAATRDALAQQHVTFQSSRPDKVVAATADDVRGIFERFQPGLDQSMKIKKPLEVSGPRQSPRVTVSIEKCVLFVCQTVDLDASISIRQSRGSCAGNYVLTADLARSTKILTDIYDALEVAICYNKTATGGTLDFTAAARRASTYSSGIVQQQIFQVLQLQVAPITRAINETLKANGAQ